MYTEVDEDLGRVLLAFNDGIFDMDQDEITEDTDPADYPDNVTNLTSFMGQDEFDYYTAFQLTTDDGSGPVPFTTYWDFLTAVARTPGFCGGVPGGMYSRFDDAAMCAKEAAGAFATIITQTNAWDEDMVDGDDESVPIYRQGLAVVQDPDCDAAAGADTNSDYCQWFGIDSADWPSYYADKNLDPNGDLFVPRGAGYIYGVDQYYWFSQIVFGDSTITDDPTLVASDPVTWWLSGMLTWMIPMNGKPAPHNIIMGQWEPTWAEADLGIIDGFGAVSALLYGSEQCGMSGHPVADARTEIYEALIDDLEAADGSWEASETVYDFESNDCTRSAREEFPNYGAYASIPQFATYEVSLMDWDWAATGDVETAETCFVVNERTDYIVWMKDSFRNCIRANWGV